MICGETFRYDSSTMRRGIAYVCVEVAERAWRRSERRKLMGRCDNGRTWPTHDPG